MAFRGELLVRIDGDRTLEDRVRSAILKVGATVEAHERRVAPNGNSDHQFMLSFVQDSALDEIIRAVGEIRGAAVKSVTLHVPACGPGIEKGSHA